MLALNQIMYKHLQKLLQQLPQLLLLGLNQTLMDVQSLDLKSIEIQDLVMESQFLLIQLVFKISHHLDSTLLVDWLQSQEHSDLRSEQSIVPALLIVSL